MTEQAMLIDDRGDGTVLVTINRPERLNALDDEMVDELSRTFDALGRDATCRVIILTGAGRGFCAGMEMGAAVTREAGGGLGPDVRFARQERFSAMVEAVRSVPQPVIAAVNGAAAGSGMGIALAADIRIAAASASFHIAAVKIGLSAGECGISFHLPRYVGMARAMEIMLTGRPIRAEEAAAIGLVTRVVADGEVVDAALEVAEAICANSPFGVRMTKRVAWANLDNNFTEAIALENRTQILATMTDDSREAKLAFVEKRPPRFAPPATA